jgi:hypothetical protein
MVSKVETLCEFESRPTDQVNEQDKGRPGGRTVI